MRHGGGARSEEGPQEGDDHRNSPTAPSTTRNTPARISSTFTYHFVKRWSTQSHEKDTAVDPGASAGVGITGRLIPPLHKVVTGPRESGHESGTARGGNSPDLSRRGARTVIGRAVTPWHCRVGGSNPSLSTRQELRDEDEDTQPDSRPHAQGWSDEGSEKGSEAQRLPG